MDKERIVSRDPEIVSGALVFAGTRVPVQILIDYLKAGETLDRFLEGFPSVSREQAEAFLEQAMRASEAERLYNQGFLRDLLALPPATS